MSAVRFFRRWYLLHLSQPAADRVLYRAIASRPVQSIVELGIALSGRTPRLLEVAAWRAAGRPVEYTAIDLFEARPDGTGPTLKQAFAALRLAQVRLRLVPGDPDRALTRVANSLAGTDLVVIAADQDRQSLACAWRWIPRMLKPTSLVFVEEPAAWRRLEPAEVRHLADQAAGLQRRAA